MCFGKDHGNLIGEFHNRVISKLSGKIFENVLNITGFLMGDVVVKEFDLRKGYMVMEVTDCLWLRSPRMKEFPEEGSVCWYAKAHARRHLKTVERH